MKSMDTRDITNLYTDTYMEMLFSSMVLRIPAVNRYLSENFEEVMIHSSYERQHLIINSKLILDEISRDSLENPVSLRKSFEQINRIFVTSMWDSLLSHATYDKIATEPEIQFFRHVRNACGHDGRFNFKELKHKAYWRDKVVTEDLKGKKVFPEFLTDGDLYLLILDIENKYFESYKPPGYVEYSP